MKESTIAHDGWNLKTILKRKGFIKEGKEAFIPVWNHVFCVYSLQMLLGQSLTSESLATAFPNRDLNQLVSTITKFITYNVFQYTRFENDLSSFLLSIIEEMIRGDFDRYVCGVSDHNVVSLISDNQAH